MILFMGYGMRAKKNKKKKLNNLYNFQQKVLIKTW